MSRHALRLALLVLLAALPAAAAEDPARALDLIKPNRQRLAKDFKVFYAKQAGKTPAPYSVDHSTGSYAFDPQGKLRLLVRHGETPANVAADLKLLLAGN